MEKQTVYILQQGEIKAVYLDIKSLQDAIYIEFDILHEDDFNNTEFKVYAKKMSKEEIDELPEFYGF